MRIKSGSVMLHLSDALGDAVVSKEEYDEVRAISERDAISMTEAYLKWEEGDHS